MEKISLSGIRDLFPALHQSVNGKPLVYLDNAATSQKPSTVIDVLSSMNSLKNGNIHRAVHELSARTTEEYEQTRDKIKEFVNASRREEIVFTSGTTASINLVAGSFAAKYLHEGDSVLVTEGEHHSNIVPWQLACERSGATLKVLPIDESGNWKMEELDSLLDQNVRIVAAAHVSNVLGIVNPVKDLVAAAHKKNIPVLIDGAQGVVHLSPDVQDIGCDFYAFSGHKMYGPTGTGILFGRLSMLEEMPPWMGGGDMVDTVKFSGTTYAPPPLKFEAGTPNFGSFPALRAAVELMESIDNEQLKMQEEAITNYLLREFGKIDGLRVYGESSHKIPLFSLSVEGAHPSDLAMLLDKMGIALRSGMMCSEPVMDKFGVTSMLRASFAAYNTLSEAEYFISSLKRAINMLR
jgi:cysteine desulfurase/selenocysteine lyase